MSRLVIYFFWSVQTLKFSKPLNIIIYYQKLKIQWRETGFTVSYNLASFLYALSKISLVLFLDRNERSFPRKVPHVRTLYTIPYTN